jgi:hypothetical protein
MLYRFLLAILLITSFSGFACAATKKGAAAKSVAANPSQQEPLPGITILSIIPAQGEPGSTITIYGTGFSERTVAFLGNRKLPTQVLGQQQLTFDIPELKAGLYALFLKREDGSASKTYNFTVLALKPVIDSLSPDTIYACTGGSERVVTIHGRNFQDHSQVLFDGAVIRSSSLTGDSISFKVPQIAGGLHQVQVRNPEETASTAIGLYVDARPEIGRVYRGEEHVNYYNLVIEGKNFQQGGTLIVEDKTLDQGGAAIHEGRRFSIGTGGAIERERVIFVDCTKLLYQRYPYDSTPKDFRLQVITPSGEGSSVVQVSAP